jgi:hypothetical protein
MTNLRPLASLIFLGLIISTRQTVFAQEVSFNRDIRPILSQNCLLCHGPDPKHRKADLRLDDVESATKSAIVPGKPDQSAVLKRLLSDDPEERMPPADSGKQLTKSEIELVRRWIAQGAKYESHWAFIPPTKSEIPKIANPKLARNAIDRFVLKKLQDKGISPAQQADRYTLIRRVSLDLTGLPPTVEDVRAFVADRSENAWEKVIDRLLKSERYGEHMARYWLDAARYADTNGYQYDLEREQWVWRDWVIHAFNSNMSFDQFTVEQIAGDLLPNATDQQRLATAFHRNHPITIEGGVIDEEYRTEYVVDRVVTTSTVWLGLTMTCGRCHDHKYDPITQKEFYEFYAFFNQVPEKGHNGFAPKLKIDSPLQAAQAKQVKDELAVAETRFKRLWNENSANLDAREKDLTKNVKDQWLTVVPEERRSKGGATLTVQPDQSILASGKNAATEIYELVLNCDTPIYAIRLEALKHPSFVGGGTGRGSNGNFVLSEFQVATSKDESSKFTQVKIAQADADYSQANYNVSAAIDGQLGRTGWAVDGNTKFEDRVATFTLAAPLQPKSVKKVRIQLHHTWGGSHHIGRLRVSLATRPVQAVPSDVAVIVKIDSKKRNATQAASIREYLAFRFGNAQLRAAVNEVTSLRQRSVGMSAVPATMVMADLPNPRKTRILLRGEYDKPQAEVSTGTPGALPAMLQGVPRNRLGLARWMVLPDHPLTARVAVNRFWARMFGIGIVKTTEDFGSQGEWPSDPELLDWLAMDFVESGWDIKQLLKTIAMSATYQQSSKVTPQLLKTDPDNRMLARGPRLRLDAEAIRDSALFASGLLSKQLGGASVFPYHPKGLWQEINNRPGYSRIYKQDSGEKLYRRSLYTFWKRTVPPPSMAAFDAPEREFCVVQRSRTNTPLQAFVMLHDPQFVESARHLGQRMQTEGGDSVDARITFGFQACHSRPPTERELSILKRIFSVRLKQYESDAEAAKSVVAVGESKTESDGSDAEVAAWTTVGRVIFNLSEFVTKP